MGTSVFFADVARITKYIVEPIRINATCLADLQKGESIAVFLAANRPANSVTFALEAGSTAKPLKESLKSH